jgi:hypothetical protein
MLIDALQDVRRRVKLLGVAFGAGVSIAVAVGLLLAAVSLDYLLNLAAWPRLILVLAALAGVGYVIARWVLGPARAKMSLSDVAGRLERAFPQFDDRLRSTVDFAGAGEGKHLFGSDIMQQRVMNEAAELATNLDLNRAVVVKPVWYATGAGVAALGLLLLLALVIVGPLYTHIALSRLFSPFSAPAWPKRTQIELLGSLPARIPVGQRFDVRMKLTKGDRAGAKALVNYQLDGGPLQQEYMTRTPDGTYVASLDAKADPGKAAGAMKIWMTSGDDRKNLDPITVLPRLAIARVEAVLTPPKYVGESARAATVNLAEGPAITAAGSEVALRVVFNKALAAGTPVKLQPVTENSKLPQMTWDRAGDAAVIGKWLAGESMRFHVLATDVDGFQNSALEEYELIVRPDQNPSVQIENPRRNEERTPVAAVPLQAVAEDDYGIQSLKLVVDRLGNNKKHWEVDLVKSAGAVDGVTWSKLDGSGDRLRFRTTYQWDLAKLDPAGLKPGDVLEYFLQVTDNFNLNNQTHAPVPSGKLRITIVSQEQMIDLITNKMRQAAAAIKDIHGRESRTREETGDLIKDTGSKPKFDPQDQAIAERLTNQQATAASQAKQVSGKLEAIRQELEENKSPAKDLSDLARDVRDLLNSTAENPMKDAAAQIAKGAQTNDPAKRGETMKSAVANETKAESNLQNAMDRMGSVGSLAQTIEKLRDLLKAQQEVGKATSEVGQKNLGKKPEQMTPEDQKKLSDAAGEQQKLAARTDAAMAEMEKLAKQMEKSDPSASEAMKQSAKTGQQQQVSANQSKAAKAARQNQQAAAQGAQKQAELGLQLMLNDLREAERRKLEELNKKLAELQEQIGNLIRRQAGHNLDNLALQGGDRLAKLDAKTRDDLIAKSAREKDKPSNSPALPAQTTSQEQTQRNAADIAHVAEDMPQGAEAASDLTRAASKMERAIVSLRGKDLPGAYEPPQVEALAALVEAREVVDKQKEEAEKKIDEQNKETIRQAYVKIREDQDALNKETARIDAAPKLPDGTHRREDTLLLNKLPGDQGKLSDRTQELEEGLSAVGSIVYIWANKDIVSSMNEVKDDLGKPATGVPTQAEQARIVEQLDAMIKNLAIKPPERRFEERENGGGGDGGGQQGPKLPTEAELKLLQDLQRAVNKSTKTIDAQPKKDNQKLLALGNRQGELRNLLDETLKKASGGQTKLRPEPDNKDQLPEEAKAEDVEKQELQDALLNDKPDAEQIEKDVLIVGDRMARSRQRLALNNDPGRTTQIIQEKIILDIDKLIQQAQKQSRMAQGSPKPGQGQGMKQPGQGQVKNAGNEGQKQPGQRSTQGATAAAQSSSPGAEARQQDLSSQIKQSAAEWGKISPRSRGAVAEGASENPIEKYRQYIDDYYKGVATRGTER